MGGRRKQALRVPFAGQIKLRLHGAKMTRVAGLLAFRELDQAFRLTERGSTVFSDPRHRKNAQYTMLAMLRQSVFGRLAGNENVSDAERLRGGILRQFAPVANEPTPCQRSRSTLW